MLSFGGERDVSTLGGIIVGAGGDIVEVVTKQILFGIRAPVLALIKLYDLIMQADRVGAETALVQLLDHFGDQAALGAVAHFNYVRAFAEVFANMFKNIVHLFPIVQDIGLLDLDSLVA